MEEVFHNLFFTCTALPVWWMVGCSSLFARVSLVVIIVWHCNLTDHKSQPLLLMKISLPASDRRLRLSGDSLAKVPDTPWTAAAVEKKNQNRSVSIMHTSSSALHIVSIQWAAGIAERVSLVQKHCTHWSLPGCHLRHHHHSLGWRAII